ncbi:TRAP transporter permease [Brachyspira hyodysenteriae]|uniref:TRAP transporter, 4TM/12TM fusion protein n=2 Tax=Brachyspira hyodysenteriae TaxID=159 RepID=A0A3B6VJW2_BRAHW|nr:TRAP transporter permease [Brachyspira hyodysenteriae]ACN84848.1 TRAP transporter, 4TM/12TM fusion protein [Brachyspira hyodysenteriae WA1]ANN63100.1 C4-dicarboxylate ABC transporter [Brachyspira hyodysenteriae ATCC 27164]AUJ50572.1 C4-dicarboxylate ABC transporter [Brachyspira hyodysenteriae]KLI16824.1 C4-dicarboxylate ABC transporter [Brachyspira hyodysenteriae]KLI24820.1 C4-dicarboxylate ABC transporter [Brachyspira hyodysenteriae]
MKHRNDIHIPTVEEIDSYMSKYDSESRYRKYSDWKKYLIIVISVVFCLFQLYSILSGKITAQVVRATHLAFVILLAYLLFPMKKDMPKDKLPWYDVIFAIIGAGSWSYITINFETIVRRAGIYTTTDIIIGIIGILLVFEACRRIVGLPILVISIIFIIYALFGAYAPGFLNHRGYSLQRLVSHLFYNTEGIMGTPIGASATFIFLFIFFGALLDKTGIGQFFIDICNAIAGGFDGGPAKVAVLTSAMFGTVSGSSVSNTVGTGSFTIPMMKSLGYRPEFAGAVEASASTGGQLMPPIMGAASFLMAESLGIPYMEVAKAAIIPAILYFTGIFIMVHLEAKKTGLKGLSRDSLPKIGELLMKKGYLVIPLATIIYFFVLGKTAIYAGLMGIIAAGLVAIVNSIVDIIMKRKVSFGFNDLIDVFVNAARNIISVAVACAMAGVIIGVITLTGLGLKIGAGLISISGGIPLLLLFLTMISSIILGMGVPTTANYLITSTIAASAIIGLGYEPLAAHMFVFYFGIIADVTPPVALAAMAGAAIAKSDPLKTGIEATKLSIGAFIIPYMFIFNPDILMINTTIADVIPILITSLIGMFGVSAGLEGYVFRKCKPYERILFIVAGLLSIYPEFYSDIIGIAIIAILVIVQIATRNKNKMNTAAA